MKILIVTATEQEAGGKTTINKLRKKFREIDFIFTGAGMVKASCILTSSVIEKRPDYILHTGICGSYHKKFPMGSVLNVISEQFSDIGYDDNGKFIPFEEKDKTFCKGQLINKTDWGKIVNIPSVKGITVNTVNGEKNKINQVKKQFHPDVESMEGAAVAYVCLKQNIPYAQIRAVSNFVEPRNVKNWNIPLAINNLNKKVIEIIPEIILHYES